MSQSKPINENRRGFIRGSSLLIASALPATSTAATPLRPQKLGLIGCGTSGVQLTAAAMEAGLVNLVALADSSKSQMQQAARSLKGRNPESFCVERDSRFLGQQAYRELLKMELDWVIVAVPYGLRAAMIGAALTAGTSVYAEQPMAVCPKTFAMLVAHVRQSPGKLHCGNRQELTIRYADSLTAIREGVIGEVQSIDARSYSIAPARLAMKRPAAAWRAEPSLAGDGTLRHRVALMELATELFGEKPNDARIQSQVEYGDCSFDSRVYWSFSDGVVNSHCRLAPQFSSPVEQVEILGSRGRCELQRGRIYDSSGKLVERFETSRTTRAQMLLDAFSSKPQRSCEQSLGAIEAVLATS